MKFTIVCLWELLKVWKRPSSPKGGCRGFWKIPAVLQDVSLILRGLLRIFEMAIDVFIGVPKEVLSILHMLRMTHWAGAWYLEGDLWVPGDSKEGFTSHCRMSVGPWRESSTQIKVSRNILGGSKEEECKPQSRRTRIHFVRFWDPWRGVGEKHCTSSLTAYWIKEVLEDDLDSKGSWKNGGT